MCFREEQVLKVLGWKGQDDDDGSGTRPALDVALSGSKKVPAGNETGASVRYDVFDGPGS